MEDVKSVSTSKVENKITINYPLLLGLSLLIILNLLSLYVGGLAILLGVVENILIFYLLLKGDSKRALLFMCLFYTTNYGNPVFFGTSRGLETIYCVENLPLFHGYLMLLMFFLVFGRVCLIKKNSIKSSNILTKFAYYTLFSGLLMGLLSMLINGFQYRALVSDLNQCVIPAQMIMVFSQVFEDDQVYVKKYLSLIIHIFLSYVIIGWITNSLNIYADFVLVRDKVLMLPMPSFYITSIILFIGMIDTSKDKIIIIAAFLSSVYFQLFFDSCMNGKSWIVFILTLIIGIFYIARNSKNNIVLYGSILVILGFSAIKLAPKVNEFISGTENTKLLEFISMFTAADSGDLDDMDSSSQFRFIEFINVTEQYVEEPIFALTGRGYGGSIHSNGYFWDKSESGFTMDQYDSDQFYRLHESVNVIYLKFGIIGILFLFVILIKQIKGFKYSPWNYIGFIWLLFFWGYQNSLLFIGLPATVIGIQYMSQTNNRVIANK